jgi:flagellar basal body-associated protein FliL
MKNKKADIAITILVLGVIVLCVFALLSFYLSETKQKSGGINSVFYLEQVYNTAESLKYSGDSLYKNYETDNIKVQYTEGSNEGEIPGNFEINGEFFEGKLNIMYKFEG